MGFWLLTIILLGLYTFACVVLIFVILIQSGKGGGLSSLGSASSGLSEALGATGAEKTLNRLTTWCAVGFMVLALVLSLVGKGLKTDNQVLIGNPPATQQAPQAPVAPNPGQGNAVPAPQGNFGGGAPGGAPAGVAPGGAAPGGAAPATAPVAPPPAAQAPATQAPPPAAPAPAAK